MQLSQICSLAFVALHVVGDAAAVTPVQKVVQLMQGMLQKGKDEKHAEQVQFARYKQFCEDTTVEKKRAVAEADEQIEVLKADIEKQQATAEKLTKEVAEHDADVSVWTADQKAATEVRKTEKADYDVLHQDYSESQEALQRAIAVLRKQAHDRSQASLAQVSALRTLRLVPEETKASIEALLQEDPQGLEIKSPEAVGYEFRSQGVIDMLKKLLDKFAKERTDLEKKELNAKHTFEMLIQDLTAQIKQASGDREQKTGAKAKSLQAKADADGDLKATAATRTADQAYLNDLVATCEQKASDFESRQQLRSQELDAITKAIEIISSQSVSGSAGKYLPALTQESSTSLISLRSSRQSAVQDRLVDFLQQRSKQLKSRVLSELALHASSDPFEKVKKMIKDLVVRLMEEANQEADHKGWCDTELATNELTRKEKTKAVETLHAEIDQLEASIAKLAEEVTELTNGIVALDAAMAEATTLRQQEKEKNEQTIADAQEAQAAVAQALTVLKEFYAKAGEAAALVQEQPVASEIFDTPYTGMQSESGGVVGMLEVIEADFARLESDTRAAEVTGAREYDAFMTDSKVDKEAKTKDIEHKTAKSQDESQALTVKKEDLDGTQKELDAALAYFDRLKPTCIEAGTSFEDRVARRKEEIESLQDALRILNGEDLA